MTNYLFNMINNPQENEKLLAIDRSKFISNPHLERKEKQAWKNSEKYTSHRAHVYWYRTFCRLLSKLRKQGDKNTCWNDWGREEYYQYKTLK